MVKPTKGGRVSETKVPPKTPFDKRGELKRLSEDPMQYVYESVHARKSPGAMGGAIGIDFTPEQKKKFDKEQKEFRQRRDESRRQKGQIKKKKDGGLMEAIKKVDAEKGMNDGGMVGNSISNFKGTY